MNNNDYIRLSLELHLFSDCIMKEHSLFLETAFMEHDKEFKEISREIRETFSKILEDIIKLADGFISNDLLSSKEIVTKNTMNAEIKTNMLTKANINTNITAKKLNLKSGKTNSNPENLRTINNINKQTLTAIENLIHFKNEVLNRILSCEMYTTNYPLLIKHILNESKMYHNLLSKIEARQLFSKEELYEQEIFWNNIMMEHAEFIR